MKKLFTLITFLFITFSFTIFLMTNNVVNASSGETVNIVNTSGKTVKYNGSSEPIQKLKNFNYPTQQLRAAWVSNYVGSLPSYSTPENWKKQYKIVLDRMQSVVLNTIVFHIRTHNNALYPSKYNPKARYVAGINFDEFDPLTYMIEETHRRGMEFHAWLNPYRVDDSFLASGETYPATNPASDPANLLVAGDGKKILNPGLPNVRKFLVDTCMEVVENYDVDAIHFDDYFYISDVDDTATRNKYNVNGLSLDNFRREQVNIFIEDLSNNIRSYNKANNRAVQLGIAPTGIYRNGSYAATPKYDSNGNLTIKGSATRGQEHYGGYLYADTLKWINEEWIDYIMPQMYWGIDFNIASFGALTRWWSWAVKYKKVNLYCGMGIYMAEGNKSGWGKLDNEVRDQLLNMGTHPEIGGMSLYSYNYINSSNSTISKGMNTLKDDFFNKFVPCDVKKSYSDLPSIAPSSVTRSGNNITWTPVDGARGYMVYEVSKGTKVDTNNIDHVFKYTASNSITITNPNKDYYVATVNQANVISRLVAPPEGVIDAAYVTSLISKLPDVITLEYEEQVNNIDKLYNGLSSAEKAKVVNVDKLIKAKKTIADLHKVKDDTLDFISTIDTHITSNRLLPQKEGFTWSYVNPSDSNIYNIKTGERLKQYLDKKIIELNLTHTLNGLTHTEKVKFNVGLTSVNETPLFYRNDASCMGPDDDGSIKPGDGKWIGWSNVALKFDGKILFIAKDNYQAVNSADEIKNANWTSCASVTKNSSSSTITFNINKVHESKSSSTDVYFKISNGKISGVTKISDYNVDITLKANEVLVVLRYLDNLNFENIIFPFDKFEGKDITLVDYNNPESLAKEVILAINNLPETVTLADEELVMSVLHKYQALPDDIKPSVTNYSKLQKLVNEIKALKEEEQKFTQKQNELKAFYSNINALDYPYKDRDAITNLVNETIEKINSANTLVELNNIDQQAKQKLSNYKKYSEDINLKKKDVIDDLEKYVHRSNYSETGLNKIDDIIRETTNSINRATSISEIEQIFNTYKQKIDNVDTLADELNNYKNEYSKLVRDYVILYAYSPEDQVKLNKLIADTQDLIGAAKSINEINTIFEQFKTKVDAFDTLEEALVKIKAELKQKINDLRDTYDLSKYLDNDARRINQLFIDFLNDVDSIQSAKDANDLYTGLELELSEYKTIEVLYSEAINEITNTLTSYLEDLIPTVDALFDPKPLTTVLNNYLSSLNSADKETIIKNKNSYIQNGRDELDKKVTQLKELKQKVTGAIEAINKYDKSVEGVQDLIATYTTKIKNATSVEEVDELLLNFDNEYNSLTDKGCGGCGNESLSIVLSIITASSLLFFAFRKRH